MNRWLVMGLLGVSCLVLPGNQAARSDAVLQKELLWLSDYEEARKLAQTSGKPLLVVFRCVP
jgi:hypothetical protein